MTVAEKSAPTIMSCTKEEMLDRLFEGTVFAENSIARSRAMRKHYATIYYIYMAYLTDRERKGHYAALLASIATD